MTLRQIFDRHHCDKGSIKHKYDRCYEKNFEHLREQHLNILEVGCFRGESISSWLQYFPNASVYTIDIFERTRPQDVQCLKDPRVKWIKSSSMDDDLGNTIIDQWSTIEFDIIIDDGAHWPEANRQTFVNLIPFLARDGAYYIEDVFNMDNPYVAMHPWVKKNSDILNRSDWVKFVQELEPYTVEHYDYTSSNGQPDSAIVKVTL